MIKLQEGKASNDPGTECREMTNSRGKIETTSITRGGKKKKSRKTGRGTVIIGHLKDFLWEGGLEGENVWQGYMEKGS